jgi:predicted nucleotidyltransferase
MHAVVRQNLTELTELCRRFQVARLELFGSATRDDFDPRHSDLDFLVEFAAAESGFADRYFGFLEALEGLFSRRVDLIETKAITNRFFLQGISRSRELLYAA